MCVWIRSWNHSWRNHLHRTCVTGSSRPLGMSAVFFSFTKRPISLSHSVSHESCLKSYNTDRIDTQRQTDTVPKGRQTVRCRCTAGMILPELITPLACPGLQTLSAPARRLRCSFNLPPPSRHKSRGAQRSIMRLRLIACCYWRAQRRRARVARMARHRSPPRSGLGSSPRSSPAWRS